MLKTILLTAVLFTAALPAAAQQTMRLPVITLTAGLHLIHAEVAAREHERRQGLMFREKLGQNEGMVFVFESAEPICMWMKNTPLPLSVAFLDSNGIILNVENMEPHTTRSHCAAGPARYALEMNQGWFSKRNIKPGMKIGGLPR